MEAQRRQQSVHEGTPPTRKQLKTYNRKNRAREAEQEHHSRPGSKAGPRREWEAQTKKDLLDSRNDDQLPANPEEYDIGDALLDDLIGNTKYNSSQPTPKPVYLGNKERHYYHRVADQMERYQLRMGESSAADPSENSLTDVSNAELPSDRDISLALRAHRDRHGTRQKPVGIVVALKLLLQDLGVPLHTFGENTYTTLLTCCRTPAEGRRILQMMNQQQHPVTSYSWSILIDIHAKIGDYEGCVSVIDEMVAQGVAPGLPAYTSLLAACYKVCTDGRISHSVRKKAGEVGWKKWQEMRIVGLDPDVMAYGAILRLCAAQGQPEKALNILEEMEQMQVKPTTLCFSSALKAVARSHATAIRTNKDRARIVAASF
jgi:pentatricopeptide repeat protein